MPLFLFLIKFQRTFTAQKKYRITSILSKAPTRFELVIEVLQTFALPLGYGAIFMLLVYSILTTQKLYQIIFSPSTFPSNLVGQFSNNHFPPAFASE